jgi:hypothetical protein
MALLLGSKINKNGSWTLTPDDARELSEALRYAADEAADHESIYPVKVHGVGIDFDMFINPHKEKEIKVQGYVDICPVFIENKVPWWKRMLGYK